ncbi:MAG: transposase family protein, partial [Planctomycetaceae bacterium]|nr:transposase family protein [Planctomycetaceae bacterium]
MIRLIHFTLTLVTTSVRSRLSLQAENAALRNQLSLYRKSGQRPRIKPADRLLWCFIAKFWADWRTTLYFVQPRTVITWQKKRFRDYWRALSQSAKPGRPQISRELRKLIERMWEANPTWGSPKIVAELAMLGIDVAKSTVEKYRPRQAGPPSPTWRTFLDHHVRDLVSIDFFIVPTATFRVLFVFILLAPDRRRIVHFNVTAHPTAQWTAQQIVEAFPFDTAPSYLIRDGDGIYGQRVMRRIESLGIDEVVTAPASPWQNAYVERVIGTLRRELFDHVIVLNEPHLKRLMSSYLDYYHPWRTHQSLDSDAPDGRPVRAAETCNVVELSAVHGLH